MNRIRRLLPATRPPALPTRQLKKALLLGTALSTVVTAAACSSSNNSSGGGGSLVVENAAGGNPAEIKADQQIAKAFEKAHPGVHITMRTQSFQQLVNTGILQLSGNNAPSLIQVNEGFQSLGQMVKSNLLVPLDSYASRYHWNKLQSPTLMSLDGRQTPTAMGVGHLWGMSTTATWLGVFYNKTLLSKIGQPVPKTFADFEHDLALAKSAGITPLSLGTAGGPGLSEYYWFLIWAAQSQSLSDIRNLIYGVGNKSWNTPSAIAATNTYQKWADNGYFTPGYAGYNGTQATDQFTQGKSLFMVNGTWAIPQVASTLKNNAGVFLLPSATSAHGPEGVTTGNLAWAIPQKGPNHDLAAQFLNFLVSPPAAKIYFNSAKELPATSFPGEVNLAKHGGPLLYDQVVGFEKGSAGQLPMPYPDWASTNMLNDISSGLTEVLAHKISAQQYVSQLQSDYAQFRSTLGH
ncbi:MAG: extracellular solute-binding protein [Acidimicrobiaceae bacterium]|nr:extracellular solute-binding protein [Acidimicrobiaceae bacterium]